MCTGPKCWTCDRHQGASNSMPQWSQGKGQGRGQPWVQGGPQQRAPIGPLAPNYHRIGPYGVHLVEWGQHEGLHLICHHNKIRAQVVDYLHLISLPSKN